MKLLQAHIIVSCFLAFFSYKLQGQEIPRLPDTPDSLKRYILNSRSLGEKDWNYYKALKKYSKRLMYKDRKEAIQTLNEAYNIATTYKDTLEMASINHMMGTTYRHWGYTYASAEYFQQSFLLTEKVGKRQYAGFDLLSIGNVYFDLEKFQEANTYYVLALKSFYEIGDTFATAVAYNNLGLVFQETQQFDSSFYYFHKAKKIRQLQGDPTLVAHSEAYLAILFLDMKQYERALEFGHSALRGFKNPPVEKTDHFDLTHMPLSMNYHIGEMYYGMEKYDSATLFWNQALDMGRENPKLTEYFLSSYGALARLKHQKGQTEEAIELLEEALNYAVTLHFTDVQERLLLQISDYLATVGKFAKSLSYSREHYLILKNKALGASNNMLNFHALFETYEQKSALQEKELQLAKERMEKEQQAQVIYFFLIILGIVFLGMLVLFYFFRRIQKFNRTLAQRNRAIEEQKSIIEENAKELTQLNDTKDVLFSVIAHDLRTPFNALTNFSQLMQSYIQNNQWEELKSSFKILDESSQKAYWTFENLLGWVQSQTGKLTAAMERVDLYTIVDETLGLLSSMTLIKKITIKKDLEPVLIEADRYMLQTVLRNLLSNAIKYSYEGSVIYIKSKYEGGKVLISIIDDGKGIPEEKLDDIFDTEQLKTEGKSVHGFGLMLCKMFVENMNGSIHVESGEGKGSRFMVRFNAEPIISSIREEVKVTEDDSKTSNGDINGHHKLPKELYTARNTIQEKAGKYSLQLSKLSVYEASAIKSLISKIRENHSDSKEIQEWLSFLSQAIYISDSELYTELINLLDD